MHDNCIKCKLHLKCNTRRVPVIGRGKKKILIILENPSKAVDLQPDKLVGQDIGLLNFYLKSAMDLYRDCWITYATRCHARKVTSRQLALCRHNLYKQIEKKRPRVILVLGDKAAETLFKNKLKKEENTSKAGVSRWRGLFIPDREWNCWIYSSLSPSMCVGDLSSRKIPAGVKIIFSKDMTYFKRNYLNELPKFTDERKYVRILLNEVEALAFLKTVENTIKKIVFDYETTGRKPYKKGHDIVSCAIAISATSASAFLMTPKIKKRLKKILRNKKIKKIAANIKFEDIWSRVILKTRVKGWKRDTMLDTHILDNRRGICGLKFQAYVNFGVTDYASDISKYIRSKDDKKYGANAFNKIRKAPVEKLLLYNGLDAIYEWMLDDKQEEQFKRLRR